MNLEQIKNAVLEGKKVHWYSPSYTVIKDKLNQWFIKCTHNEHCVGLTWMDGVTLNGKEQDFFIST